MTLTNGNLGLPQQWPAMLVLRMTAMIHLGSSFGSASCLSIEQKPAKMMLNLAASLFQHDAAYNPAIKGMFDDRPSFAFWNRIEQFPFLAFIIGSPYVSRDGIVVEDDLFDAELVSSRWHFRASTARLALVSSK
jgi:hypothetical protein